MRILGFSQKWAKLKQREFTTFRFARKDKDWEVGELVQVAIKQHTFKKVPTSELYHRTILYEKLGIAKIVNKQERWMGVHPQISDIPELTEEEAIADGFESQSPLTAKMVMYGWLAQKYGKSRIEYKGHIYSGLRFEFEPMNKLTLQWVSKET